jgi:hypothetical protein
MSHHDMPRHEHDPLVSRADVVVMAPQTRKLARLSKPLLGLPVDGQGQRQGGGGHGLVGRANGVAGVGGSSGEVASQSPPNILES